MNTIIHINALIEQIKKIELFASQFGKSAAISAIYHGAFNTHPLHGDVTMSFIHPSDELRQITEPWILGAFANIVN